MKNKIAVIDYDCLTTVGADLESSWGNLMAKRSGIGYLDRYDRGNQLFQGVANIEYAGQIPLSFAALAGSEQKLQKWPEPHYHAVLTLTERVLKRLDFNISRHDPQRIAFLGGTALSPQMSGEMIVKTGRADPKYILNQCANVPLAAAASVFGIQGPSFNVGSACASSGHAVLLAANFIRNGMVDCAVVAGWEFPLTPLLMGGLSWLNALYRRELPEDRGFDDPAQASRPFSRDRSGFLPAEGAGLILLADFAYARKLDWPIKGYFKGGYLNSDGGHLTRAASANLAVCMSEALKTAKIDHDDIGCVSAHATSTPLGDAGEMEALAAVFGHKLRRLPVTALKSQLGHAFGAASILAAIFALEGMNRRLVPATLNYLSDPSLPAAGLEPDPRECRYENALVNSFGFGNTNVSLILGRT
jgi:3-oxoacyl-[acyl-carrier-protein] synthase II